MKYLLLPIRIWTQHHTVSSAQVDTEVKEHCKARCHEAGMMSSVLAAFLLPLAVSTMAVKLPYFCSFEDSGLCGMEHGESGDFNWTRHTGNTPSGSTGPDRAADGDWYMYIETSHDKPDNRITGDKAYIQTPTIEYTGEVCIRFQYHMYGGHIGRLVVFVDTRGENSTTAFTKNANEGDRWHNVEVNVNGFQSGERVVFMAECGEAQQGDIALDDLQIAKGSCPACRDNNGGCEHICLSQDKQVICSCHDGYIKNGPRCIPATPTGTPSTTSPSSSPRRYSSSTTTIMDTPVLTNTISTVQRSTPMISSQPPSMATSRVTGPQPPSMTTSRVTEQQTENTTVLEDQLNYCVEAYSKLVDADQAFESVCETEELLFNEPREQCFREACRRGVEVVAVRNKVCDLKLCHDRNIQLAASAGSLGWDIFVLNRTWSESLRDRPGHSGVPMWQVIVVVIVVVLAVIALAVGIVLYLKRRKMVSQATELDRVYYENDAALPTRPAGDVTKPADEAPYENVECPRPITSAVQIQISLPLSDPEEPNSGGYEDLEPYAPRVGGPYDVIL